MSNNPPNWPNGAPPPTDPAASPFRPLQPPPYGTYSRGYPGPDAPERDSAGQTPGVSGQPADGGAPYLNQPYGAYPVGGYAGQPGNPPYGPAGQAPLGAPPPAHVSIESFAPRRDRRPLIIVGVLAILVVGAIITAIVLSTRPSGLATSPTASPRTSSSATRSPAPNGQAVAFESSYDKARGYWQITKQTWDSSGVLLSLSVRMDEGSMSPFFYVFNNDTNAQYRVDLSLAPTPRFPSGGLSAPKTYTGNVYVPMPHVDGTLIMMSGHQSDAVSALAIKK